VVQGCALTEVAAAAEYEVDVDTVIDEEAAHGHVASPQRGRGETLAPHVRAEGRHQVPQHLH
jgi:hypothetical protein